MLRIVQKSGNLRDFWTIFKIFAKWILKMKKMTGCIIAIFTSTSIFLLWLGEITHMSYDALKVVLSLNIKCRYVSFNNALPLRSLNPMIWYLFFFVIGFIQQLY